MSDRKVLSTPPGTTAVLFEGKTYAVGEAVPAGFPEEKLSHEAAVEGAAASTAVAEGGKKAKGKKGKK